VRVGRFHFWQLGATILLMIWAIVLAGSTDMTEASASVKSTGFKSQYSFVHDPSLIKSGNTYYLFSTGESTVGNGNLQIRTSKNLRNWHYRGTIFHFYPKWLTNIIYGATSLWAPDISYYKGRYQIYYAGSTFGSNNSVIGLITNATLNAHSPKYKWIDQGLVIESTSIDAWNAIDPNFVLDASGHPWLAFGSFWSGIKLTALNAVTRKPSHLPPTVYSLAYQPKGEHAIEAPFIVYHKPYYYLFASAGICCQGINSTYHIVMGRSTQITGPYKDEKGIDMMNGGASLLLAAQGDMIGPGGESVFRNGSSEYMVYHYYDAKENGAARVQIRKIVWRANGWPSLAVPLVPVPSLQ